MRTMHLYLRYICWSVLAGHDKVWKKWQLKRSGIQPNWIIIKKDHEKVSSVNHQCKDTMMPEDLCDMQTFISCSRKIKTAEDQAWHGAIREAEPKEG
jgi:hypothetical protein